VNANGGLHMFVPYEFLTNSHWKQLP